MITASPVIGIDFGTSKSSMAWYDPRASRAEIIRNYEGREITPSVVYFDRDGGEILVGQLAENKLEEQRAEQRGFVVSVKRNLVTAPAKVIGGKVYKPVDVAAKILQKLKQDAEKLHFHQCVSRAVITYPASFDIVQQDKIKQAAMLAGFSEVQLLPEPIAAALAYMNTGYKVGNHILVYDFGGGTFDVAVLSRISDGSFIISLEPEGLNSCGGDDLDRELYFHCEEIALQKLHRSISLIDDIDLRFLRQCRSRKENLSGSEMETFSSYLSGPDGPALFEHTVERHTFEGRINKYIDHTVTLTKEVISKAYTNNYKVDTVVLIGGSSRIPLVLRSLSNALPVAPVEWQQRDFAVVLGAAYHAQRIWGPANTKPSFVPGRDQIIQPPPSVKPQPGPGPAQPPPLRSYGPALDAKVVPPPQVSPNPIPPPPPGYIPPGIQGIRGIRGIQAAQPVTQQKNTAAIIVYVVLLLLSLLMAVGFLSTDDGQGVGVVFAIVAVVFFVLLIRTSRKTR